MNNKNIYFTTFLFLTILIFSCKKENNIGLTGEQSPSYKINQNLSFQVKAVTERVDSIVTSKVGNFLLGSYVDPVFGKTESSFATQFFAHANTITNGKNFTLDSITLTLKPDITNKGYGNINSALGRQHLKVYELLSDIDQSKTFYNTQQMVNTFYNPGSQPIVEADIVPSSSPIDTIGFKFKLSTAPGSLGERIVNGINSGVINNENLGTLLTVFKGLYFITDNPAQQSGEGCVMHFNPDADNSQIQLYLTSSNKESSRVSLVTGGSTQFFNVIKHDYSGVPFLNQLNGTETEGNSIYVQSGAGVKAKVVLPFLKEFRNKDSGNVVINKCEITFQLDKTSLDAEGRFAPFKNLSFVKIDSMGKSVPTPDEVTGVYFNGGYNSINQTYTFNLTRYAQQIVTGAAVDYGLFLQATAAANSANRVVLLGKQNILVNLIYTKLK